MLPLTQQTARKITWRLGISEPLNPLYKETEPVVPSELKEIRDHYLVPSLAPKKADLYAKSTYQPLDIMPPMPPKPKGFAADCEDVGVADIIASTVHSSNELDKNTTVAYNIRPMSTEHGPVWSTQQLLLVARLPANEMTCHKIQSFGLRGISSRPEKAKKHYIGLRDPKNPPGIEDDYGFIDRIDVGITGTKRLHPAAVLNMRETVQVRYDADFVKVGRVPVKAWQKLQKKLTEIKKEGEETGDIEYWRRIKTNPH